MFARLLAPRPTSSRAARRPPHTNRAAPAALIAAPIATAARAQMPHSPGRRGDAGPGSRPAPAPGRSSGNLPNARRGDASVKRGHNRPHFAPEPHRSSQSALQANSGPLLRHLQAVAPRLRRQHIYGAASVRFGRLGEASTAFLTSPRLPSGAGSGLRCDEHTSPRRPAEDVGSGNLCDHWLRSTCL